MIHHAARPGCIGVQLCAVQQNVHSSAGAYIWTVARAAQTAHPIRGSPEANQRLARGLHSVRCASCDCDASLMSPVTNRHCLGSLEVLSRSSHPPQGITVLSIACNPVHLHPSPYPQGSSLRVSKRYQRVRASCVHHACTLRACAICQSAMQCTKSCMTLPHRPFGM